MNLEICAMRHGTIPAILLTTLLGACVASVVESPGVVGKADSALAIIVARPPTTGFALNTLLLEIDNDAGHIPDGGSGFARARLNPGTYRVVAQCALGRSVAYPSIVIRAEQGRTYTVGCVLGSEGGVFSPDKAKLQVTESTTTKEVRGGP